LSLGRLLTLKVRTMNKHETNFVHLTPAQVARALGGEAHGNQVSAPGPGHGPNDRSLSIKIDPTTRDGFIVNTFSPKDDPIACKDYVREKVGAQPWKAAGVIDPMPFGRIGSGPPQPVAANNEKQPEPEQPKKPVATYAYTDENGVLLYEVVRYEPKGFSQRHYGPDGKRIAKRPDDARVPYMLPLLRQYEDATVLIVEGEKDCEAAIDLGWVATTNDGGAGSWHPGMNEHFRGRDVVIIPDHDLAGRARVLKVFENLNGVASSIKVFWPPEPDKAGYDFADWLKKASPTANDLAHLINALPIYDEAQAKRHAAEWSNKQEKPEVPASSMKVLGIGAWLERMATADTDPLIEDIEGGSIIGRREIGIIYGETGTGKTTVLNEICLALASGRGMGATLGGEPLYPCSKARILYVVCESQVDYSRRLQAILRHYGLRPEDLNWGIIDNAPTITEKKDCDALMQCVVEDAARYGNPDLVVFDTLAAAAGGRSLNDDDVAGHCFTLAYALRSTFGTGVIFAAHTGKDTTRGIAGSYRFKGNSDFILKTARTRNGWHRLVKEKDKSGACNRILFDYRLCFPEIGKTKSGKPITGAIIEAMKPKNELDPVEQQAAEQAKAAARQMSNSVKVLRESIAEVVLAKGKDLDVKGDRQCVVKAVLSADVKPEFASRYVYEGDDDDDPSRRRDAISAAYTRALKAGQKSGLVGIHNQENGTSFLWLPKP
jgi:hypothetical protein